MTSASPSCSGLRLAAINLPLVWHEWLSKSHFSFLLGASPPFRMVKRAAQLGYSSLALCDMDGVYGLARAYRSLKYLEKRDQKQQLELHYGGELHLEPDHHLPVPLQNTVALIAMSPQGYAHLCRIFSQSHAVGKTGAYLGLDDLARLPREEVAALSPMRGLIRRASLEQVRDHMDRLRSLFPERFFAVISRHQHGSEDVWIEPTLQLIRDLDLPFVCSQDAFFHQRNQVDMSDLLHAIRTNQTLSDAVEHMFPNGERCLHTLPELQHIYGVIPGLKQALEHSADLAARCRFDLGDLRYHYPKEMIPEGYSAQSFLEKMTWEQARMRYGNPLPEAVSELLNHELVLIRTLDFADYFLTVWDIVTWARKQNILCQGRGSAANSAVCFVLGITSVDPAFFDLLFERFISVERGDPPDIDVDFEHERREEVIQYIYRRFGRHKAAMVANVITFRRRGAIRAVGRALGVPDAVLSRAADVLGRRAYRAHHAGETLEKVRKDLGDEVDGICFDHWAVLADRLVGFPRHLGIHPGGFVLSDQPIDRLVAQEPATMENRTCIQWCKDDIEALGFFKVDILGLGMLTALRKCFDLIDQHLGQRLSLHAIPKDDRDTYRMIQRADTVGTFQIESRAQMSMLPRLKPNNFYDLVIEIAIIRPGPIQGGMVHPFLRRRYGQEPVTFPDERLEPILKRTLGVPIFQEQVMRIAMAVGGFNPGEANELRRHIGSFSVRGDVDLWIPKLIQGMKDNGIPDTFIESIVGQLQGFASYGFPESHSASFALLAYASAYLKCHFPAPYFCAILNSQPMGFYEPHTLLQTARHAGIPVLPVCVQRSAWDCTLEWVTRNGTSHLALRMGFRLVHFLSESGARQLLTRREITGPWQTMDDVLQYGQLSRVDLTALAAADAFAVLGVDRRAAIWKAEAAPFLDLIEEVEEPLLFPEEAPLDAVRRDFIATSTSLRDHPVRILREQQWCYEVPRERITLACDVLRTIRPKSSLFAFGMVTVRQAPPTAHGMLFATIEDETGLHNLVIRPPTYKKYQDLIENSGFFCVRGFLQKERDAFSILVTQFYTPQPQSAEVVPLEREQPSASPKAAQPALLDARNYM